MDIKKLDKIYASKKEYKVKPSYIIDMLTYLGVHEYDIETKGGEMFIKLTTGHGTLIVTLKAVKSEK